MMKRFASLAAIASLAAMSAVVPASASSTVVQRNYVAASGRSVFCGSFGVPAVGGACLGFAAGFSALRIDLADASGRSVPTSVQFSSNGVNLGDPTALCSGQTANVDPRANFAVIFTGPASGPLQCLVDAGAADPGPATSGVMTLTFQQ